MTHNSKEKLLLKLILCIMLVIGGKELWAFDRHAKPTFVATWTLDKTAPEYNALPKCNSIFGSKRTFRCPELIEK